MNMQRGFSLIELMVTIAIVAILAALAAPSFIATLRSNTVATSVNSFLADARYARSEALKRGTSVIMCASASPESTSPTCITSGSGVDVDGDGLGDGWAGGWIVFEDRDGSGNRNGSDEPVLRAQASTPRIESIMDNNGTPVRLRFTSTGRLRNLSSAAQLTFGGVNYTNAQQRVLCISVAGHVRIAGDGTTTCS